MSALQTIENKMAPVFKDLPALPDNLKESLAKVWPWLALIGGVLQLLAALALYHLANYASRVIDVANSLSAYYAGQPAGPTSFDKTLIYIGVLMLVIDAIILLVAFPKLQKREKAGWDLLFLGVLINLAYGVVQIFTYSRGIGSFIGSLIGSAIAFYLLFQIREKFGGKKVSAGPSAPASPVGDAR
ncbi:MAG TPA: hypothetical protein VM124_01565 [Candidatus Limnocylindrales bacterium]|nr:hypothetical protein [Candidatus Limnocylindrales bacterium]